MFNMKNNHILKEKLLIEAASLEKIVNAISNDVQQNNLSQSDIADLT